MSNQTPIKMFKNFGRGDFIFSLMVAYFFTWFNALNNLKSFFLADVGKLILTYAFWLVFCLIIMGIVTTFFIRRPVFGRHKAYYFPLAKLLPVALILVGLFAVSFYLIDPVKTLFHTWVYIVGALVGVAVLLGGLYFMTKPDKSA